MGEWDHELWIVLVDFVGGVVATADLRRKSLLPRAARRSGRHCLFTAPRQLLCLRVSMSTADDVDLWRATPEEWAAHVRDAFTHNPAQCVLPVTADVEGCSLWNYAQGSLGGANGAKCRMCTPAMVRTHAGRVVSNRRRVSTRVCARRRRTKRAACRSRVRRVGTLRMDVVHDDLRRILPPEVFDRAIAVLEEQGVDDAFRVRRELVNYKKVCLNLGRAAAQLDRDLRQLATFFRGSDDQHLDDAGGDEYFVHSARHTELNDHLGQCKGALGVVSDLRQFIKTVCCVPRHPGKSRPAFLRGMPHTLRHLRKFAEGARVVLRETMGEGGRDESRPEDEEVHASAGESRVDEAAGTVEKAGAADEETADGMSHLRRVMAAIDTCGWPAHFGDVIMKVLIAKGAVKALWMHDELNRGGVFFLDFASELRNMLEALTRLPTVEDVVASGTTAGERLRPKVAAAMRTQKHLNLMTGAVAALTDQCPWLTRIAEVPTERLFLAGDDDLAAGTSMFIPRGFTVPLLFDAHRQVADTWRPRMRAQLVAEGWPEHLHTRLGLEAHADKKFVETTCRLCDQGFSSLWVHRSVCVSCEMEERQERCRCPYRTNCASPFCPHARRCFVCDSWSCGECQLIRGDGEDVAALAHDLKPDVVFLDFDRTLCTTRGGGSPLVGSHTVDPDLMSLVCNRPIGSVRIVTRNSYREDIKTFLEREALPKGVPIHTVKKHQSKAEVVCDPAHAMKGVGERPVVLFVDDSVAEHLDPRLVEHGVHRVLFGRAL